MDKSVLDIFHPVVKEWFEGNSWIPSAPQVLGWPKIESGKNVLISSPTGSGKTLAAFLESINRLLQMGINDALPDGVYVLYVSPLKALNNDIYKNLDVPLQGIKHLFDKRGEIFPDIKKAVRTGDTTQYERQQILKKPPHILITTPESLFLMLTSNKAQEILKNVHYLIVDEIHTLLGTKRGVHLALSMERLEKLAQRKLIRIGLSATVNPIDAAAKFLGGANSSVEIIKPNIEKSKDLKIQTPVKDFRILEQGSVWPDIYDALLKLIKQHHSTIVFVNNRATAEKVAANVNSLADSEICLPHHGSISKNMRLDIEERFKYGDLKCIVATSTLELGIDIGSVDFIAQVGSPLSVSSGLQRLGRAGHKLSEISRGVIIPKTRGDLLKSLFIAQEMLNGHIEKQNAPVNCLDILSQHIVSMCCCEKWSEDDMFNLLKHSYSYRTLTKSDFIKVLKMLSGDFEHMEDIPAKPRIIWDRHKHTVEGNSYSKMLAVSSSGTIPDQGSFSVYLEDHKTRIGELDEAFVFESRIGDRFFLGNSSWRIARIDKNKVMVAPCNAVGAKSPFWKGDGIGMPYEQAVAYGKLLKKISTDVENGIYTDDTNSSLIDETGLTNIRHYLLDQLDSIGTISNDKRIVVEYTSSSDTDRKIVIHAHFGGRVNSVLAILFQYALDDTVHCKAYTSYTDDAVLIHFYGLADDLSDIFSLISSKNIEQVLIKMLPNTSRFSLTFRYNAYRALMMGIRKAGQRLPLWIQRLRSVDVLENAQKYTDHPLIIETMRECLEYIFDIPNTIKVLENIEQGKIQIVEKSTWFPSPFASEILFQFQQVFLYMDKDPHPGYKDYPAISSADALNLKTAVNSKKLREDALAKVVQSSNTLYKLSEVHCANELHSFFLIYGDIEATALSGDLEKWLCELVNDSRVVLIPNGQPRYIATEEMSLYGAAESITFTEPNISYIHDSEEYTQNEAILRILRRFARYNSPFTKEDILDRYFFPLVKLERAITELQNTGLLIYHSVQDKYFHSIIYDRAVRLTLNMDAGDIKTRDSSDLASFICHWQKVGVDTVSSEDKLYETILQFEGLYLPISAWENIVFPARVKSYTEKLLDRLCTSGRVVWRILPSDGSELKLAWFQVENLCYDSNFNLVDENQIESFDLEDKEKELFELLLKKGATFTHVLTSMMNCPTSSLLPILKSMVEKGYIVNDSFQPLRYMTKNEKHKITDPVKQAKKIALMISRLDMGRWELAYPPKTLTTSEYIHRTLKRYGIITKEINALEQNNLPWLQVYDTLKQMEYSDEIMRGYFFSGISGIQFMIPDAFKKLNLEKQKYIVLNACDPAQPYGRIIAQSSIELNFICVPGTAVVLHNGRVVFIAEKYGERLSFSGALDSNSNDSAHKDLNSSDSDCNSSERKRADSSDSDCDNSELTVACSGDSGCDNSERTVACSGDSGCSNSEQKSAGSGDSDCKKADLTTSESKSLYNYNSDILLKSIMAFTEAFKEKRIWPERKKITVKYWAEDSERKEQLISALNEVGFLPELDRMVLWRSQ